MPSEQSSALDDLKLQAAREVLTTGTGANLLPLLGPAGALEPMRGKKVLVTGATGLIGSIIVATLKAFGGIKVIEADSAWGIQECLKANADYVIHGAGYAQPKKFLAAPLDTIDINTNWTMKLAKALPKNGRMLFLSTSEVCNGSPHQRHTEDDIGTTNPAHIRGAYIESKRCGEAIVHAARAEGKAIAAARVSLAYGPGVKKNDGRVVSEFITQALRFGEIKLQDGGQARRTYCYVTDVVQILLNILTRGQHALYNVGGESEITILSMARKLGQQMQVPVIVPRGMGSARTGAPAHVTLDMSRTKQEFKKFDFVPIDRGLERTIAWHRALEGIEESVPAVSG